MSAPQGPPPSQPPSSQPPSSQPPSSQQPLAQPPSGPYGPPSYAGPATSPRVTEGPEIGLPPGVTIADLGPRLLAWVVDASVPIVLTVLQVLIGAARGQGVPTAVSAIFAVLSLGWFVFVWWGYATKAAGPGARVAKLQLVGMSDGRPVGWGRYLVRALVFGLAGVFFPVLIGLLIIMVRHPRRQGWHDLAVGSVLIRARPLAPRPVRSGAEQQPVTAADQGGQRLDAEPTVGIPASYGTPPPAYGGYGTPAGVPPTPSGPTPSAPAPSGPAPSGPAPSGPAPSGPAPSGPAPYGFPSSAPSAAPPASGPSAHYGPVSRFASSSASPAVPSATPAGPSAEPVPSEPSPAVASPAVPARAQEDDAVDAAPPAAVPVPELADAPVPGHWQLELDGREITLERLVLLGRNPQRGPGEDDAEIVKVRDEARTVSKTHVAVGVDDQGLFVVDRGSTNGSAVTDPDGVYRLLRAGEPMRIDAGWTVAFGSHEIKVSAT